MKVVSLSLRNLLRNRRRSLTTLAAVVIGAVSVLLFGGYRTNIEYALQTVFIRAGGHLQIQHHDFFLFGSGNPTAYAIDDYARIAAAIRADPQIRDDLLVVTPTLQFGGLAGNYAAGVSRTVVGNGLVAVDQVAMRKWDPYDAGFVAPDLALARAASNAAVVGVGLARVLQLCDALEIPDCPQPMKVQRSQGANVPSDIAALTEAAAPAANSPESPGQGAPRAIELLASNARGTPNVASLEVAGAENQGFKELDEIYLLVHLAQAQQLVYGSSTPKVTAIQILLRDTAQTGAVQARIAEQLMGWSGGQPLTVRDFGTLNPFYTQSVALFNTIFGFMFVLIGGIVMFTVSNTMNTAVVERTVEVGTLRAIGLRRTGIRTLFVVEGALIGTAGAVIGAMCALASSYIVNRMGLVWTPPGAAVPVPLLLKVWGQWLMIVGTTIGLILVTIASAWWPAHRAAGLKIVDALRHV
jgi:putative ABC transport system permease protein